MSGEAALKGLSRLEGAPRQRFRNSPRYSPSNVPPFPAHVPDWTVDCLVRGGITECFRRL